MEGVIGSARQTAVVSAVVALVSLGLLGGDRGWWALGITFLFVACSVCVLSGAVWLVALIVRRRSSSPLRRARVVSPASTRETVIPALPEAARRTEIQRLRCQLDSTRDEWDKLQADLGRLEFRFSVSREPVAPLDYLHLGHWRLLDAEYRNRVRDIDERIRALAGPRAAS